VLARGWCERDLYITAREIWKWAVLRKKTFEAAQCPRGQRRGGRERGEGEEGGRGGREGGREGRREVCPRGRIFTVSMDGKTRPRVKPRPQADEKDVWTVIFIQKRPL
jgi:hypothetical protein